MPAGRDADANASAPAADSGEAAVTMRALAVKGARGDLPARLYEPAEAISGGLIVFFPPGGFVENKLEMVDEFVRALAACTRRLVLSSSYTLAGVAPFPAAAEDAYAVLQWALRFTARKKWKQPQLVAAGIEAGGNLAAVAALMARDRGGPPLAAQVLIMPMLDPGLTSCSMRSVNACDGGAAKAAQECAVAYRDYLPNAADRAHPYASPLQSSRLKNLPPALVLTAEEDPLRDEAEQYGAKLASAGVRATVRRMQAVELSEPDARCSCARRDSALQEMTAFLAALDAGRNPVAT